MKQKFQKMIKIAAFSAFAIAMLVNLKTNILSESAFNKAFATETKPASNKKYALSWSSCTGTRMCGNKMVTFSGVIVKCIAGSDLESCTDGIACTPNSACQLD